MSRMGELAEAVDTADQLRASRPMSMEALLMQIGFMAADFRRLVRANPGCLNHNQEFHLMQIRSDLESCARIGGCIDVYANAYPVEAKEPANAEAD